MQNTNNAHRPCVVCREAVAIEPYCAFGDLDYVLCRNCGLVYVDRLASDAAMRTAYTGRWFRKFRRKLTGPFRRHKHHKYFAESMERGRRIFEYAARHMNAVAPNIRFLDIGCNKGFLLAAGIQGGAEVYGIELVPEIMRPFCNSYPRFRENIYSEKLSKVAPRLGDEFFDLITAIDVVEHFEDPVDDMHHIYRMLRLGGVAVIQTPDAGCEQAARTGCAWGALKPLEHLHLFNRQNFAAFAEQMGFRDIQIDEPFEHADGNFVAVLKK